MKIKLVLTVNALLSFAFGVALIVRPFELSAMYGLSEKAWGVTGLFGTTLIGFSFLLWSLRRLDAAHLVVARALVAMNGLVATVALAQQQAIWNSTAGWVTAATHLLLAAAYLCCLLFRSAVAPQAWRV